MQTVQEGQEDLMQSLDTTKERSGKRALEHRSRVGSAIRSPESEVAAPRKQKKRNQFNSRQLVIAASSASPAGGADLSYLTPPKPEEGETDDDQQITSGARTGKLSKKYSNPFLGKQGSKPSDGSRHARLKANTQRTSSIEKSGKAHMSRNRALGSEPAAFSQTQELKRKTHYTHPSVAHLEPQNYLEQKRVIAAQSTKSRHRPTPAGSDFLSNE